MFTLLVAIVNQKRAKTKGMQIAAFKSKTDRDELETILGSRKLKSVKLAISMLMWIYYFTR